jgi:hypothetical protein
MDARGWRRGVAITEVASSPRETWKRVERMAMLRMLDGSSFQE